MQSHRTILFCWFPLRESVRAAVYSAALSGCGAANALPDDAVYFGVGVDPEAEMHAVTTTMEAHGFTQGTRIAAPNFIAVAFRSDEATALRIATARGVVFALEATTNEGELSLDPRTGTDLDGDDIADIVISRIETARTCLALAAVDAEGFFQPMRTNTTGLDGATCIESLRDVTGDGQVEALVPMQAELMLPRAASITIALTLGEGRIFALHPGAITAFLSDERARREALVLAAVDVARQEDLLRLACEIAWSERIAMTDGDTTRIAQAFDATLAQLPLNTEVSARAQAARARLLQTDVSLGATASVND